MPPPMAVDRDRAMTYDLIVIGSGPGGYKAAVTAAQLGANVALIEAAAPGGTCLNQGCIPKEALLRLARLLEETKTLRGRGLVGDVVGDFRAALAHKNDVIRHIREPLPVWLRQLGIHLVAGRAQFLNRTCVEVHDDQGGSRRLEARRVIIATGARPRPHPACPTDGRRILDSRHFMLELDTLPASVLCVGGGAIGCELAYVLHQFGAHVTIAEQSPHLLNKPCITDRARAALERKFARMGIEIRTASDVAKAVVNAGGVDVDFQDGTSDRYERVLVAIGRIPNSQGLGLDQAGIVVDQAGFIETDAHLQTAAPGIYAVGDVKRGPMTANAAFHDAKIAAANAITGRRLSYNYHRVPIVIDSALQIAAVGLTEDLAEQAGFEPDTARANLAGSTKARIFHDGEGYIEVVHDEQTGQLLGGCIVGPDAGEMIHLLAAACQSPRGLWFLTDMNYSHPSWNEEFENAISRCISSFTRSGTEVFRPGIYAIDVD